MCSSTQPRRPAPSGAAPPLLTGTPPCPRPSLSIRCFHRVVACTAPEVCYEWAVAGMHGRLGPPTRAGPCGISKKASYSHRNFWLAGTNVIAAAFMQKRWPVGAGPSGKTWPRWAPLLASSTSVRMYRLLFRMSSGSGRSVTWSLDMGSKKEGQPVPLSYLAFDEKTGRPETAPTSA